MKPFASELRRGWRNLAAATVGMAMGIPSYTPVSSMFFRALEAEFGWAKAVAAGALIAMPVTALVLPVAGWLIDRLGVRICAGFSVLASALCYLWLARMSGSVGEYYGAIIALNVLGCATGPIAYTRLVASDFEAGRGTALAISQFGIALFAIVLPPVLGPILAGGGTDGGYFFLFAWTLAGGIVAQLLMRPGKSGTSDETVGGTPIRAALASLSFWKLGLAVFAISVGTLGFVAQFQSIMVDRGFEPEQTAWLLSTLAASVMISRLVVGRLLDLRFPHISAGLVIMVAAAGAVLFLFSGTSVVAMTLAILLLGFGLGAELDLMSFFCARLFGLRYYAAIYGALSTFFYTGIAVGGIGYSVIRDATGSYVGATMATAGLLSLAAILFLTLGDRSYGTRKSRGALAARG